MRADEGLFLVNKVVCLMMLLSSFFSELESEVEMVRLGVVQRRCIANPMEIENLNNQLGIISRQVADLKSMCLCNDYF